MRIFADADALPNMIKEILYRAAERTHLPLILVANTALKIPRSEYISCEVVSAGPDVADKHIAEQIKPGDLVITADIPLAEAVIEKGGFGLNPRGELYTENNIKTRIAGRDLMFMLRDSGINIGGPAPFKPRDRQAFANKLDQFLTRYLKSK
jgi:uncharacterized protein YaiI (UPF0178 family)